MCVGKAGRKVSKQTSLSLSKPVENVIWVLAKGATLPASLVVPPHQHCSDVILQTSALLVCAFLLAPSHVVSFGEAGNPVCICLVPGGLVIFSE